MKPVICGKPKVYIPDRGCSDCYAVERRVTVLEEWKPTVDAELTEKLETSDLYAGDNITITSLGGNKLMITATGGGGGDMTNYYTKQETYNKQEVDDLIGDIEGISIEVVSALPSTGQSNIIYLVQRAAPATGYDEYVWVESSSQFELIGSTDVDLSGYYTKTEVDDLLDDKVDKVSGKGLSTNDYTTAEKNKLAAIEAGAEVNVQSDWNQTNTAADDFIKNKPGNATTSAAGLMSSTDKTKLDGITWTKAGILAALGYEEVEITMTDVNDDEVSITVIKSIS